MASLSSSRCRHQLHLGHVTSQPPRYSCLQCPPHTLATDPLINPLAWNNRSSSLQQSMLMLETTIDFLAWNNAGEVKNGGRGKSFSDTDPLKDQAIWGNSRVNSGDARGSPKVFRCKVGDTYRLDSGN
jgi:hypothetical protein